MLTLLKFLSGLSLHTLPLLLVLIGLVSLGGCTGAGALKLLTGGGPKVAANTQIGKSNNQTIGTSTASGDQKVTRPQARDITQTQDTNKVNAEKVKTIVVNEYPVWLILAFVAAVFLDSPVRMVQDLTKFFRKKK